MKKLLIILCFLIAGITTPPIVWGKTIKIKNQLYSYEEIYALLDERLESLGSETSLEKYERYKELYSWSSQKSKISDDEMYFHFAEIFQMGEMYYKNELETNLQTIHIGLSTQGRDMYAYFRGIPEDGYKLIVANIHGGYEYGTYETANMLVSELGDNTKSGWFIIPTLNPDGLQAYFSRGEELNAYLSARGNANGVDLNRNFCSENFRLTEFNKYGQDFITGVGGCESETETQVFTDLAEEFYFTHLITLHSVGGVFYIPDNSIYDKSVILFGKQLLSILPDYDFYPDISSDRSSELSIIRYEMDEGGLGVFTGTMEDYVYEKYNIPVILIELSEHGKVEEKLKDIFSLDI